MCRQPLKLVWSCSPSDTHSNVAVISGNTHENNFSRVCEVQSSNFLQYVHLKKKFFGWFIYTQPSGSLFCGRRWHFLKPALSTDQFKLKVISQSKLYIYTLNVSCIMLVYYFLQFIVNNCYFLFQVSNGHNILSFPKVVQIPPESPCIVQ